MNKTIVVFSLVLFGILGYAKISQGQARQVGVGAEMLQEMEARELLLILTDLPDNHSATSPRHNDILKKRVAHDLLYAYFAKYKNKQKAVEILITEMQILKKTLSAYAIGPIITAIRMHKK